MVELVTQGTKTYDYGRPNTPAQAPSVNGIAPKGTEEEKSKDEELRDVSALSDQPVHKGNIFRCPSGKEEGENRYDKA